MMHMKLNKIYSILLLTGLFFSVSFTWPSNKVKLPLLKKVNDYGFLDNFSVVDSEMACPTTLYVSNTTSSCTSPCTGTIVITHEGGVISQVVESPSPTFTDTNIGGVYIRIYTNVCPNTYTFTVVDGPQGCTEFLSAVVPISSNCCAVSLGPSGNASSP